MFAIGISRLKQFTAETDFEGGDEWDSNTNAL
jgi:hypothetical protein